MDSPETTKQFVITPAAGKRLIARALAADPIIRQALESKTVVIVAGTTNGYVAEEILASLGAAPGAAADVAPGTAPGTAPDAVTIRRERFFRGLTLPPGEATTSTGRLPREDEFAGDVVLRRGVWEQGRTIFDVIDDLGEGDIVLKGANALDVRARRAAVLIGNPDGGTAGAIVPAVVGRRIRLIVPVGLEKRVTEDLDRLAARLNAPGAHGPRLLPLPGAVFTELDAIDALTGAASELVAAGGVCGAEGSLRLAVTGTAAELDAADRLIASVVAEPAFEL